MKSLYLREEGVEIVTSARLSRMTGLNSALIRRDLSKFGKLGHKGQGHDVVELLSVVQEALGSGAPRKIALVGANMKHLVAQEGIDLAVVAVSYDVAQQAVDLLVQAGIKEIVNYSHARVTAPSHVHVHDVAPVSELLSTLHYLSHQK